MSDINKYTTKEVLNKVLLDSSGNAVNAYSHTSQEALNAALDDTNSRLNVNLVGGTIGGDVTINGDLTVNGTAGNAYDEIVNGDLHIKSDSGSNSTNAFLVEKNDGTDVFIVDTTNSRVGIGRTPTQKLDIYASSGNQTIMNELGGGGNAELRLKNNAGDRIIRASADKLQFIDNADSRADLTIDGSGNVGIGTASPTSKLSVSAGRGANTGLEILDSADSNNKRIDLRLDADGDGYLSLVDASETTKVQLYSNGVSYFNGGNVGIGRSTNIDKKLHILSSTSGDGITLEQSSVGSNAIRFEANSSALRGLFGSEDSDGGAILSGTSGYAMVLRSEADIFLATNGNNEAFKLDTNQNARFAGDVYIKNPTSNDPATLSLWSSDTSIADDDNIGVILAQGSDSGGSPPYTGAKIEFNADAVWDTGTSNYYATRIDFFTQSNTGADTLANPALTIDSTQNVNIGSLLSKTNNVGSSARGLTIANATAPVLSLWDTTNAGYHSHFFQVENNATLRSSGNLILQTNAANTALTIDTSQNATFSGKVAILSDFTGGELLGVKGSVGSDWGARIENTSSTGAGALIKSATTNAGVQLFQVRSGSDNVFTIMGDQNATFAGDITVSKSGNAFLNLTSTGGGARIKLTGQANETTNGLLFYEASNQRGSIVYNHASQSLTFNTGDSPTAKLILDDNSRISLSNNDSGTSNTVFGKLAGDDLASGGNYNSLFGESAGHAITTGDGNVIMGHTAGQALTTGVRNVLLGRGAGLVTTNAQHLIGIGFYSLSSVNSADASGAVAVGYESLKALTSGAGNTSIGYQSSEDVTTGEYNTVMGYQAFSADTDGSANVVIGWKAGRNIHGSTQNVMIGYKAMANMDNNPGDNIANCVAIGYEAFLGSDNDSTGTTTATNGTIAIGHSSLKVLTTGASNTAVGYQAGLESTVEDFNTYIGYQSGYRTAGLDNQHNTFIGYGSGSGDWTSTKSDKNTGVGSLTLAGAMNSGIQNTALGFGALNIVTTGDSNVGVGVTAGNTLTSGSNNTIIGTDADVNSSSSTNRTSIGQGTIATEDNSIFIGNSSAHTLYIGKGRTTTQNIRFNDASEAGMIQYDHSNQMLRITVEGTEHSRFGSSGDLVLLHGGINFLDAEGTSASSDANTLDDYEEGTFTGVLTGSTSGTVSSTTSM